MAPPRKALLWKQLQEAKNMGIEVPLTKQYVMYTEAELDDLLLQYVGAPPADPFEAATAPEPPQAAASAAFPASVPQAAAPAPRPQSGPPAATDRSTWSQYSPRDLATILGVPLTDRNADRAGLTFNTHGPNDPLRVDTMGRVWFMDEVQKPAIPKPRMRRKVRALSSDVRMEHRYNPNGTLDESFEVAGENVHEIEIKITLPSSQVGVYFDPRFPFKIHQYNGRRAFDYEEIRDYYGGLDLIPTSIREKTIYIGTDLCFDMNAVRDTIEKEYRERVLGRSAF